MWNSILRFFSTNNNNFVIDPIAIIPETICKNYVPFNNNSNEYEIDIPKTILHIDDSKYKLWDDYIDRYMEQTIYRLYYLDYDIENQKYIEICERNGILEDV